MIDRQVPLRGHAMRTRYQRTFRPRLVQLKLRSTGHWHFSTRANATVAIGFDHTHWVAGPTARDSTARRVRVAMTFTLAQNACMNALMGRRRRLIPDFIPGGH